jgi:hypothetical protein
MSTFTIQLSEHAVQRFQQRVRPSLALADAEEQLARLAVFADLVIDPPAWHAATCAQLAPWYLVLGDVVLPLKAHYSDPDVLVATTCIARGERSDAARERHRARRKAGSRRFARRSAVRVD